MHLSFIQEDYGRWWRRWVVPARTNSQPQRENETRRPFAGYLKTNVQLISINQYLYFVIICTSVWMLVSKTRHFIICQPKGRAMRKLAIYSNHKVIFIIAVCVWHQYLLTLRLVVVVVYYMYTECLLTLRLVVVVYYMCTECFFLLGFVLGFGLHSLLPCLVSSTASKAHSPTGFSSISS